MKKLATLILAAGLVFGAATGANAVDFKAKGQWIMSFDYGMHGNFMGKYNGRTKTGYGNSKSYDDFDAMQRVRLQLNAVASESLSGTVYFEIGDQVWGQTSTGGQLGADGLFVEVKNAYIDWMIPETDAKVRMGLQTVNLPSYTLGASTVMADDVAAINASMKINDNVGVTAIWMRPFNDNYNAKVTTRTNYMDNMDMFTLLVPLSFDGAKVTPWGMYGAIGPNTFRSDGAMDATTGKYVPNYLGNIGGASKAKFSAGMFPVGGAMHRDLTSANGGATDGYRRLNTYGSAWWGGLTGEVTMWDPFRVAWDFTYGSVNWENDGRLNRQGWLASLLLEYKMDWAIPGLYFWYGSGDDANPANGSERMPTVSDDNTNGFSNFAFSGDPNIARDSALSNGSMSGTWGLGARLKDMSFLEDLKHTFRINYIGGTNSPTMAKKMSLNGLWANGSTLDSTYAGASGIGFNGMYLTKMDSALEFGLTNVYKMYENFQVVLEADYIAMWLNTGKSVWGARHTLDKSIPQTDDAWNINASFVYSF